MPSATQKLPQTYSRFSLPPIEGRRIIMRPSTLLSAGLSLLGSLALCRPVQAQSIPLGEFAHPDSKVLIGVEWSKARNSAAGKMLARRLSSGVKTQAAGPGAQALDALDMIDRVLISSTGSEAGSGDTPPFVLALEGRIDRAKLKKLMPAGTAIERFKGIDLYVPPKAKAAEALLAVLDDRNALVGDRRSLSTVLDGRRGVSDAGLASRAATLAGECEIWMVATAPVSEIAGSAMPQAGQFDDILGMDFGISLSAGLGLRANVQSKDDAAAQKMATLIQLIAGMASQDKSQNQELAKLLRALDVRAEGSVVRIRFDVSAAQLDRTLTQMEAAAAETGRRTLESLLGVQPSGQLPPGLRPAVKGFPAASAATARPPAPAPEVPAVPQKRTIRIVGADDGEKEVTYMTGGRRN
jgi:hypothetical protein